MARRHALRLVLFTLGTAHLAVPTCVLVAAWLGILPFDGVVTHDGRWLGLIAAGGFPLVALSLAPTLRAFARAVLARSAAAMLLLGTASSFAGLRIVDHHLAALGPIVYGTLAPGAATGVLGIVLMPWLARRPERREEPATWGRLPVKGPAFAVYAVLDWLMLRLFGAALLVVAFSLWRIHDVGGSFAPVSTLLYGQEPLHAVAAYGAAGAIVLLPFGLPRGLARPETVPAGVVKAALIASLAVVLLPAVDSLVEMYVPFGQRAALEAALPPLIKGLAGVMLMSTIVIAFFRHLDAPMRDAAGNVVTTARDEEMRALRVARMQRD